MQRGYASTPPAVHMTNLVTYLSEAQTARAKTGSNAATTTHGSKSTVNQLEAAPRSSVRNPTDAHATRSLSDVSANSRVGVNEPKQSAFGGQWADEMQAPAEIQPKHKRRHSSRHSPQFGLTQILGLGAAVGVLALLGLCMISQLC
eukprot:CAMPEP_0119303744 /NCGR_PEP_ID=MMETSP1333-20130426/5126_1 /TAXON_ID=418940 /ORGANISM="Scyphosphaera apsteinii, Strain RCC1455" /LENGTH=145 /DNA_ID=CAMNT_0007306487 /DNA_START=79 /DNA_END=516 /DNA_ORIENTATION=+